MRSKHDQYSDGLWRCAANAESPDPEIRAFWRTLAESYRLLLYYEQQYPTIAQDGSAG
jgi:hypothetical protein